MSLLAVSLNLKGKEWRSDDNLYFEIYWGGVYEAKDKNFETAIFYSLLGVTSASDDEKTIH